MAITFCLRGDSLTPRVNGTGGPEYGLYGQVSEPASIVDAGAIGGTSLSFGTGGALLGHRAHYGGVGNWPSDQPCSVLMRINFFSLSASSEGLFYCGSGGRNGTYGASTFQAAVDSTNIIVSQSIKSGLFGVGGTTFAHGGLSNSTWYDIVITFTGDTTTNGLTVYLDGSSLGSATSTRAWDSPRAKTFRDLVLGFYNNADRCYYKINEFVLWDEVIDPTSVTLTSGSGSLNGASRTAFVDADASDGSASAGASSGINLGSLGIN